MPDDSQSPMMVNHLASRPLPQPIVTLPTYTTADALSLFARLLDGLGYHETRSALLKEAGAGGSLLAERAASLSEVI